MPILVLSLFRFVRLLLSGHVGVAMENAALRVQLAAFQRKRQRPVLIAFDRLFWVGLSLFWNGWRAALRYVQPDTVVRWAAGALSQVLGTPVQGGPTTTWQTGGRCRDWSADRNGSWLPIRCAPRIHGELKMLGIAISERTVSRILRGLRRPPTQTWKTFLHNHLGQLVSMDFFTAPTVTLRVLFVFIVEHRRREVLHFNVTEHPTAAWTSQQIIEAFADRPGDRHGCQIQLPARQAGALRLGWPR